MYQSLTRPAGGKRLHFAGEAISTRHAWVEGALDSAWRAVYELLLTEPGWAHLLPKFFKDWGYNAEWFAAEPGEEEGAPGGRKKGPMVGVPYGQWEPPMGKGRNGEPDVDAILKSSLLPKHIALSRKEYMISSSV